MTPEVTDWLERNLDRSGWTAGSCYEDAAHAAFELFKLSHEDDSPITPGRVCVAHANVRHVSGVRMGHAFVVFEADFFGVTTIDMVLDTNGSVRLGKPAVFLMAAYAEAADMQERHAYSLDRLAVLMAKHEGFGPFDDLGDALHTEDFSEEEIEEICA